MKSSPVRAWCCARDRLPTARDKDGIARALADWRAWLEQLRATFETLDRETNGKPPAVRIEHAATCILAMVVERTSCDDAWYGTFATTLGWYIERISPNDDAPRRVAKIVGGRFESWIEPAPDVAADVLGVAARVYLDVCFFHPFADGNARAARLALDWVLTRAGLALHVAEPIFALPRWADDAHAMTSIVVLLDHLTGSRA